MSDGEPLPGRSDIDLVPENTEQQTSTSGVRRLVGRMTKPLRGKFRFIFQEPSGTQEIEHAANLDRLRGPKERRFNLSALIRSGLENVIGNSPPHDDHREHNYDGAEGWAETLERWNQEKPERNAITAVLTSEVWKKVVDLRQEMRDSGSDVGLGVIAYDKKKGFHLSPIKDQIINTFTLQTFMYQMFNNALLYWDIDQKERQRKIPVDQWTDIDKGYNRLEELIEFGKKSGNLERDDSIREFISRGTVTATKAIWETLDVIPGVFKRQEGRSITRADWETIAANSFPLILRLAAGNIGLTTRFLSALENRKRQKNEFKKFFDPHHFVITTESGQPSLQITEHALETLTDIENSSTEPIIKRELISDTTGCPAMYAKGVQGKSVIAEMYDWSLDIARKIYFPRFAKAA